MARITEKELVLPALFVISEEENKQLDTSSLIKKLEILLEVDEADQMIIIGRKDSYFSQKVRNLKSHNTLIKNDYAMYSDGFFTITKEGEKYLEENRELLKLLVEEEKFLNQNSIVVSEYFNDFNKNIEMIKELLKIDGLVEEQKKHYLGMLFSSIITSLEVYLSDALKYNLKSNNKFLIKFVETFRDFKDVKCDFNDIFNLCDAIDNKVEDMLMSLLYHNLPKIQGVYRDTFDIRFLDIGALMRSVSIRHDLVHRNGKTNDGICHNITKDKVLELCTQVASFVQNIEEQFKSLVVAEEDE